MIAVKRVSLLFGVAYGGVMFEEERIGERMLGAALRVAGVAVITVWA